MIILYMLIAVVVMIVIQAMLFFIAIILTVNNEKFAFEESIWTYCTEKDEIHLFDPEGKVTKISKINNINQAKAYLQGTNFKYVGTDEHTT